MRFARDQEYTSAVGLNAIHAIISAADAVTVYRLGVRSAGEDHRHAIDLLTGVGDIPNLNSALRHHRKALALKNTVAYEDRELTAREARDLAEHAERFCDWAATYALPQAATPEV